MLLPVDNQGFPMALLLSLISLPAFAGKLADGWRGHPYGPQAWLQADPGTGICMADPEPGVRWRCTETMNAFPVSVNYIVTEGIYTGIYAQCEGYSACSAFYDVLVAAWGPITKKAYSAATLSDGTWRDGRVMAGWDYNEYSAKGSLMTFDLDIEAQRKARAADRAAEAAGGI